MGADPIGPISTKIGKIVGVHYVIIHSKFGFNIFRGFRSTVGQNFRFPFDFAIIITTVDVDTVFSWVWLQRQLPVWRWSKLSSKLRKYQKMWCWIFLHTRLLLSRVKNWRGIYVSQTVCVCLFASVFLADLLAAACCLSVCPSVCLSDAVYSDSQGWCTRLKVTPACS